MIKLKFEKTYRTERYGELCSAAVPFPKGKLHSIDDIVIVKEGIVFPSQSKVTSYWDDKSIRWIFVYFLADLPADSETEYYLSYEGVIKNIYLGNMIITCRKDGMGYTIDTGVLKITFESGKYAGIKEASAYGVKYYPGNFKTPVLEDIRGRISNLELFDFEIIEEGPVCVVIEAEGIHSIGRNEYRVRFRATAYANSPIVDISYRLFNTSNKVLTIKSMTAEYHSMEKSVRTCVAISNNKTEFEIGENGEPVEKVVDAEYLLDEVNEHISEVFYGTMFADCTSERGGVCVTIYQAHQNYPKALYADEDGFLVSLVPEQQNGVVMQPGTSREQRFMLRFHDAHINLSELNNESIIYQMPDRPIIDTEVYQGAGVFQDVFIKNKLSFVERVLVNKADSHARCFGMMNWGDSPDSGYTVQGKGSIDPVWTNNEYDFPHAAILQYVRTGKRRFLDYALVSGRHWIDVDVCHYSIDPLLQGGQWKHSRGHVINSNIECSHQWVEGLLDYYHFTGDHEAYDTAIGIGENILKLLDAPVFKQKDEINARETGWALRSLTALYTETDEERFIRSCDCIVGHFEDWEKDYGHWLIPYTDNASIRVVYMISVAIGSLMRYYRVSHQERIKNMIIRAVDDLIENCYSEDCELFINKELPSLQRLGDNPIVLEALTAAYELTGNVNYLKYGKETFMIHMKDTGVGVGVGIKKIVGDALIGEGTGTRDFAQSFIPVVTYYKAAFENNII